MTLVREGSASVHMSVVIGFRDWGLHRIPLAARCIADSFGDYRGEIIISDYGSADPGPVRAMAEELGLGYVYTECAGEWSRSRALNAGFARARGELLISTDVDMLFSPTSFARIYEMSRQDLRSAYFLQCRDLPPSMSAEAIAEGPFPSWEELEAAARLRPRWGMGGMMAIRAEGLHAVRGFDERLHTWGGEDIDFAQRARRAGYRTVWVNDPRVRMYHMWHPSSRAIAEDDPESRAVVRFNRTVVRSDSTTLRNVMEWRHPLPECAPAVTVAIATRNRADILGEAITSVLAQTMRDLELLIVDDGSEDGTAELVASFADPRIRYIRQEHSGVAAARNRISREARGEFIAVLDDDDLMHPRRLEWQLGSLVEGVDGAVGSFVSFNDRNGAYRLMFGQQPSQHQLFYSRSVAAHGTWLIRTSLMRAVPYNESLEAGIDHDLFARFVRLGARFVHIGKPILLRRMHEQQITSGRAEEQESAARRSWSFYRRMIDERGRAHLEDTKPATFYVPVEKQGYEDELLAYLPDSLVRRTVRVSGGTRLLEAVEEGLRENAFDGSVRLVRIDVPGTADAECIVEVRGATWSDIMLLTSVSAQIGGVLTGLRAQEGGARLEAGTIAGEPAALPSIVDEPDEPDDLGLLLDEFTRRFAGVRRFEVYRLGGEQYRRWSEALGAARVRAVLLVSDTQRLCALASDAEPDEQWRRGAVPWLTSGAPRLFASGAASESNGGD